MFRLWYPNKEVENSIETDTHNEIRVCLVAYQINDTKIYMNIYFSYYF